MEIFAIFTVKEPKRNVPLAEDGIDRDGDIGDGASRNNDGDQTYTDRERIDKDGDSRDRDEEKQR